MGLAGEGANLVLVSRTPAQLDETRALIASLGRDCLCLTKDVASEADSVGMAKAAIETYGKIDILVNNAGIQGPIGPAVDNDPIFWMETLRVNVMGTYLCCRAVLPHMTARRQGKIVNLSGGGSTGPRPNFSAYAASKAAVVRFTETLAQEVREFGIQVNAIAPGAVNTRMLTEVLEAGELAGGELEAARQRECQGGTPPELPAALAVFLASSASGLLTGKLISAPHDSWASWGPEKIDELNASSWFTLRRLDEFTVAHLANKP
jgi:3-oxoacyl-[acyl-carrier protein] reductase